MLLLAGSLALHAETEEQIQKQFAVSPGGKVVVDVDFGSIEVATKPGNEVTVEVVRKVSRRSKTDEQAFLAENPVTLSQEGQTITIRSRHQGASSGFWRLWQHMEAKYTISVPTQFNADLRTSGGGIAVVDLTGDTKARTSGGGLKFSRLHGTTDGETSGGGIHVLDCEGGIRIHTSGGGIDVSGGSGTLSGDTSGGHVAVKDFRGPASVHTSGGGISLENVTGEVKGSTSGGSINARLPAVSEGVKLETSGGGVTVQVPETSAFDLDASTSGGGVSSELPVTVSGKIEHNHLKGPVNGGGKQVYLRTSGGSIRIKKI